jgi:tetratricopeptide (TPR) repeat protein
VRQSPLRASAASVSRRCSIWVVLTLALALLSGQSATAAPITVSASVESTDVAVGEPFVLSIVVDGAQNVPVPSVAADGFRADYMGPATEVQLVNGRMSAKVTHRYRMIADGEGQVTLGPFVVGYEDQRYETKPIAMTVRPAGSRAQAPASAPGGGEALRLVVRPAREQVYVGERVEVVLTLYVGEVRVRDLKYPVIRADGVTVEKFGDADQGSEVVNGRRYTTVRLPTHLTPVRAGDLDLQVSWGVTLLSGRRLDSFFDQVLPGQGREVEVRAEPVRLSVLPLPDAGRPPGFAGAVGSYQFDLTAKPTTLDAGDPITLRMEIAGTGNLAGLAPPPVATGDAFRRYDPQPVKGEDNDQRRVFEQVIIPNSADVREIPAVSFSFFDPAAGAYQTITRGPIPLEVHAAAPGRAAVLDAGEPLAPTPAAAAPLGRDIVYIKDVAGSFTPRGGAGLRGWLLAVLLAPPLLYGAALFWTQRRERLAADPRLGRFRAAGPAAQRALAAARGGSGGIDAVATAMTVYLAAKLDLPPGAVERDRVLARLAAGGVADGARGDVERFFALAEQARYAAGRGGDEGAAIDLAERIVAALERERGLERRLGALVLAALASAALFAGAARAAEPPLADFLRGNQAYADGRYDEAIAAYQAVRAAGWQSGALEYNLGNAYMKRGDIGRAVASYERAVRRLPRDPDVAANLAFARERAAIEPPALPLWQRLLAPFATRATGGELTAAFALAWLALWSVLAVRLFVPSARPALGRLAAVAALPAAVLAVSLLVRLTAIETADAGVIVAAGETAVRFEPSPSGTEHFVVGPGTDVILGEERAGWRLVARADGRRGWVPVDAVESVE